MGIFSIYGTSQLAILDGAEDSGKYIDTLSEYLLPFIDLHYGRDCIFQQDGASIHRSSETRQFLEEQNVAVMS